MKYIPVYLKHLAIITSAFIFSFGFYSLNHLSIVEAQTDSTYMIDLTGNGCGTNCSEFYQYLATKGISVSGGNNQSANQSNQSGYQYVQYPYQVYEYYQNPAPKYDSYVSGYYPEQVYVYYGKDSNEQLSKYRKDTISTPIASTSRNSGFTITSIQK